MNEKNVYRLNRTSNPEADMLSVVRDGLTFPAVVMTTRGFVTPRARMSGDELCCSRIYGWKKNPNGIEMDTRGRAR